MNKMSRAIVKGRILILILAVLLLIPAAIGYIKTRTNYDVLTYLPKDIETMKGQDILANDFGTGAFSLVVVENMKDKDIVKMVDQMETVDHVKKVVWYGDSVTELNYHCSIVNDYFNFEGYNCGIRGSAISNIYGNEGSILK